MPTQSLSASANERGRIAFRALLSALWGGSQADAARALQLSEATVSNYIAGKQGAGGRFIGAVAAFDPLTALAMSGAKLHLPPHVAEWSREASQILSAQGTPAHIAGWAALQTLYLCRPDTLDDLVRRARVLASAAQLLETDGDRNLLPQIVEGSRNSA